jgi:hypothetical protein
MHQSGGAIHNLKKFFSFMRKKYTPVVYKDLPANILLSKKENNKHKQVYPRKKTSGKNPGGC